jgi:SAM-dependent methyltransferase
MSLKLKEKLKTIVQLISEPRVIRLLISFRSFGYLLETGWLNSFKKGNPVDSNFKPLPWFTYSAIDFLEEKLRSNFSVLEFGCGNSTLFFAERVEKVVSIEHNSGWFNKLQLQAPQNVELILSNSESARQYLSKAESLMQKFDLVIVDGLFRNECISESLNLISNKGIIILDDSERRDYKDGKKLLIEEGFRKIDFSGIAPGIFFRKCTTIFYREMNLFGI